MSSVENLPSTMKAVVCHGPKDYRLDQFPRPTAGTDEVIVKILACGICAGDAKCYSGAPHFWTPGEFGPSYCQPPVIAGHEFIGEVVELGPGAAEKYKLALGDRCIAEQIVPCWACRYCQRGAYNNCKPHNIFGFRQKTHGGMAEYMKYPAGSIIHKVPQDFPPHLLAFTEPLACAVHAVELGNIKMSHVVVVAGCGSLGLGAIAAARMKSPALLIALDVEEWKLEKARKCGAHLTINPKTCDAVEEIKKLTDGYGCDVYIEISGNPASVEQGLHMLTKQGVFVEYSVFGSKTTVDWTIISDTKELRIVGGHLGPYCYPTAIRMIAEKILPAEEIVTHTLPLEKFQEGIEMVVSGRQSLKVVLVPDLKQ